MTAGRGWDAWARALPHDELSKAYLACGDADQMAALERETERRPPTRPRAGWWFENL